MFNKKQLYLIGSLALALSLVLVQVQVKAAWTNPGTTPGGTTTNPPLTNPLNGSLNLNGWDISSASSTASTDITGIHDLQVTNNLTVTKINNQTPSFGGLSNPLTEDIDGDNKQSIKKLMGCDPAKDEICGAVEAQAGLSQHLNSFAAGLYGYTQAASGVNPSYAVYGDALNAGGVAVYGLARDRDGVGGKFINSVLGGKALVTNGLTELNGNLNVIGNADVSNMLNGKDVTFSGNAEVTGTTFLEGLVTIDNGADVFGSLDVSGPLKVDMRLRDDDHYAFGLSAIVGYATSTMAYEENAGVEGIGTVGVFGHGRLVGVYGSSGAYAGLFKGYTDESVLIDDPTPGLWGSGGGLPSENPFSAIFGINKSLATLNTPAAIGIVATGGWNRVGASFESAGLGICALSGEKAYDAEAADGDFYEYCKDGVGANNFAGFFAGNVYIKEGSMQIRDSLIAGENLIYGDLNSAASGSNLLLLQNNHSDKFKVDKDGASTFSNLVLNKTLGAGESLIFSNLNALTSGNLIDLQVGGSSKFRVTRDGITTIGSSLTSPANLILNGNGSYINFDGAGTTWPTCNASNEGVLYYGKTNKLLCACNGSSWQALDNDFLDTACSNTVVPPVPLH